MATRSAHEISRDSRERPGDHAPDPMRSIEQSPCDFAHPIEFVDRNHVFMRSNLKDAVAGGVDDGLSGSHMLFAKLFDDFRSRRWLVSDGFSADEIFEFFDQLAGKSVPVYWQGVVAPHSGHLPCPGARLL